MPVAPPVRGAQRREHLNEGAGNDKRNPTEKIKKIYLLKHSQKWQVFPGPAPVKGFSIICFHR
jgi:hypothetical protein